MPESIKDNASIIGRIISVYWESLPVKLHVREKDRYNLIEQSTWNNASKLILKNAYK